MAFLQPKTLQDVFQDRYGFDPEKDEYIPVIAERLASAGYDPTKVYRIDVNPTPKDWIVFYVKVGPNDGRKIKMDRDLSRQRVGYVKEHIPD